VWKRVEGSSGSLKKHGRCNIILAECNLADLFARICRGNDGSSV
jgi:hypothetical protein